MRDGVPEWFRNVKQKKQQQQQPQAGGKQQQPHYSLSQQQQQAASSRSLSELPPPPACESAWPAGGVDVEVGKAAAGDRKLSGSQDTDTYRTNTKQEKNIPRSQLRTCFTLRPQRSTLTH